MSCLALLLGACHAAPDTETRILARQQAVDPPSLWRMEIDLQTWDEQPGPKNLEMTLW